ncbi:MAG: molybdopterin-dependent oxidoreductase [Deltaproteobacteria bacterium]|nr:molybdopterin-dependent oxidoreductase [Deltaproteobacteria bacterium]
MSGTDPHESWPRVAKTVRDCKKSGGKLIVVDPRETDSTKLADIWLQLRPGTDTALFMSMINVVIEEGLYDRDFVEEWCHGFDKLAERARDYPPEKAAEITCVSADKIKKAARLLGENKPFYSWNGMGTEQLQNSIQAVQARLILAAITGSIDAEGGTYLGRPGRGRALTELMAVDQLSQEQKQKQLGADRFKFQSFPGYDLIKENTMRVWGRLPAGEQTAVASAHQPTIFRAILTGEPYPVRAVITHAHNPMVTQANTKLVYKALKNLDLHVVLDYWLTPTAELADYVLPVASWLERPDFMGDYAGEQALPSSIPGEYDHKSDYEIFRGIGIRLGQDWPWKNLEEVFDYMIEPSGKTFKQVVEKGNQKRPNIKYKNYEKTGFATPTGKVELYSTILEKLGYDPLPRYEEPPESPISTPDSTKEYPLILITGGRFKPMFHSEWRQIDSIRRMHPHPLAQIHPEMANSLGINDGDWMWIESPRGRVRMKCRYFEGIDKGVVHCQHGWWYPELPGEEPWLHGVWESNINVLTDDEPDNCNPINGGWPLRTALCRVYKCKTY